MHILGGVNSSNLIYTNKIDIDKELTKVNPIKALASGQFTTADIGKTVYLSNSAMQCQEWRIADIDHDGTSGTVDLFSKYVLDTDKTWSNVDIFNYHESNNYLRNYYLNGTVYNGFSNDIKNAMKVQSVYSNAYTLNDKIKLPSLTEIGCNYKDPNFGRPCYTEGTIYPLFGVDQARSNSLAYYRTVAGNIVDYYFTRSRLDEYYVATYSFLYYSHCKVAFACTIIACIRF